MFPFFLGLTHLRTHALAGRSVRACGVVFLCAAALSAAPDTRVR